MKPANVSIFSIICYPSALIVYDCFYKIIQFPCDYHSDSPQKISSVSASKSRVL